MIDVNLLPPEIKEDIAQAKKNKKALGYFWRSAFLLFAVIIIGFGAHFLFNDILKKSISEEKTAEQAAKKLAQTEAKAKNAAEKLSKVKKIDDSRYIWSNLLAEIDNITPTNIRIVSLSLDANPKTRALMNGTAPTKNDVANYSEILEKSKYFEYVDIISTQSQGIGSENFSISFSISKDALK